MDNDAKKTARADFKSAVNMTPRSLEAWLETDESNSVGQADDDGEAVGHKMGRRIIELRAKKAADYDDDDYKAMEKVAGYVKRHLSQGGPKDAAKVETSRWRYSLMNWGHDPMKD